MREVVLAAGGLLPPPAVCRLASKPVASPWLRTLALPFSGSAANRLCSCAGLTRCSVACSFQACAVAALPLLSASACVHSPLASSSPPPSCALRLRISAVPLRHSPSVSSCSSGSFLRSQGPARRFAACSCSAQAGLAVLLPATGRTLALPLSWVCGASGHSAARSRSRKRASACGSGCAAQGVTRAVAVACGCAAPATGGAVICSSALTRSSVSGPRAVAWKASGSAVLLAGRAVVNAPARLASSTSGPLEVSTARPL